MYDWDLILTFLTISRMNESSYVNFFFLLFAPSRTTAVTSGPVRRLALFVTEFLSESELGPVVFDEVV